jgi:hypothetical protein
MRRVVLVLALGVAALGAASTAAAQTGPPPLTGETINAFVQETAGFGMVTFTCAANGSGGSGTFTTEGVPDIPGTSGDGGAIGPYTGTATESGSLTISGGSVTAFSAGFQIFSGTTTITGTKTLHPPPTVPSTGTCGPFVPGQQFLLVSALLEYDATIDTGSGTFTDSGDSTISMTCFLGALPNTDTCTMQEGFNSDQATTEPADECSDLIDNDGDLLIDYPADPGCESATDDSEANPGTPPQCGDDDDGDGLRDDAESLFGRLLGNPDSDADGVRDGNEDEDDDGEDDEDEDDDECEDEDEDDDGEDDEDEDDDD